MKPEDSAQYWGTYGLFFLGGWALIFVTSIIFPPSIRYYFRPWVVYREYKARAGGIRAVGFKHLIYRLGEYVFLGFAIYGFIRMTVLLVRY